MKSSTRRTYALLAIVVFLLIGWAVFFHFVPPEVVVEKLGIQNAYFTAFLLAVVGGFSSFTGTSLYAILVALAQGGVNPLVLGIVSGLGLFLSDSLFYLIASYGRKIILKTASRWETVFDKIRTWVRVAPDWLVYIGIFAYVAFAPIPNDILLTVLAVSGYSYRQFALYLLIGDATFALLLTHFAERVS